MGFATEKLKEMYRMMNGAAISKIVRDHNAKSHQGLAPEDIFGTFKIHVSHGENLKPMNKNGLSHPYVVIRVPEGTVMASEKAITKRQSSDSAKTAHTILTGSACDLVKFNQSNLGVEQSTIQ